MKRLEGKTAIITGGAGGIGAATGQLFCEEGARVALVDLADSPLAQVAQRIRDRVPGAEVLEIPADVGTEAAAAAIVGQVLAKFGTLEVLVNLAGIRSYEPLAEAKARDLAEDPRGEPAELRLPGARGAAGAAPVGSRLDHQRVVHPRRQSARGHGTVRRHQGRHPVDDAHARLRGGAAQGARQCGVPGPDADAVPHAAGLGRTQQDLLAEKVDHNLQRRWCDPREVAFPILWLASDEASFCTASTLMVDGGTRV